MARVFSDENKCLTTNFILRQPEIRIPDKIGFLEDTRITLIGKNFIFANACVINPADRLKTNVATNRAHARFQPIVDTLRKKISGSIDGEAIQKDMTGPSGTPEMSREEITGITPQEQNGLNAPMSVASRIPITGFVLKMTVMYREMPLTCIATARGIVNSK